MIGEIFLNNTIWGKTFVRVTSNFGSDAVVCQALDDRVWDKGTKIFSPKSTLSKVEILN